jgi:hypothetical protein
MYQVPRIYVCAAAAFFLGMVGIPVILEVAARNKPLVCGIPKMENALPRVGDAQHFSPLLLLLRMSIHKLFAKLEMVFVVICKLRKR